jgi:hypothetical protein
MALITYLRPSGSPITVNDCPETRALAVECGWVEVKPEAVKKAAKKSK